MKLIKERVSGWQEEPNGGWLRLGKCRGDVVVADVCTPLIMLLKDADLPGDILLPL